MWFGFTDGGSALQSSDTTATNICLRCPAQLPGEVTHRVQEEVWAALAGASLQSRHQTKLNEVQLESIGNHDDDDDDDFDSEDDADFEDDDTGEDDHEGDNAAGAPKRPSCATNSGSDPPAKIYGRANERAQATAQPRRDHPTFEDWRSEKLSIESLHTAIMGGGHKCRNVKDGKPCHVGLWGDVHTSIQALRHQREWALPVRNKGNERKQLILNHLALCNPQATERSSFKLLVGTQVVCPQVYCDNWCISRAQLDRYIRRVKNKGCRMADAKLSWKRREAAKKDNIVTWFVQYAAEVTEKLPDCDKVLLPRMLWKDLYCQFCADVKAAGIEETIGTCS